MSKQAEINYPLIWAENLPLETKRCILRPIALEDTIDMFEYANDEETTAFLDFPRHQTLADTRVSIANYFMKEPFGKYVIEEKASGKMLGTIDLRVDENQRRGEIGYALNKKYWGQGIVPEAAQELLQLGFEKMQLVRIEAFHHEANLKSGRVMEKIGMTKEGCLRNYVIANGKPENVIMYAITSEDYFANKD